MQAGHIRIYSFKAIFEVAMVLALASTGCTRATSSEFKESQHFGFLAAKAARLRNPAKPWLINHSYWCCIRCYH